jgi:integrase
MPYNLKSREFRIVFSATGNSVGNHWMITGYPGKKRERHYFHTEGEAKDAARELNEEIREYGVQAATMSANERYEAGKCIRLLRLYGMTLTEVVEAAIKTRKSEMEGRPFGEIIDECLALAERRARKGEISSYERANLLKAGNLMKRSFPDKLVAQIKRTDIMTWLDSLDATATTRDFYRRYAVRFFSFALQREYIRENPAKGIPKSGNEGEIGIFTVEECRKLLTAAATSANHMLPYYALGLFAGLRPLSEIKRLDWSAIDWTDRLITVRNWKTGKTRSARFRHVNMSANLLAWLEPFKGRTGSVWPVNFDRTHRALKKAAGIEAWPHDCLRHSYASYLLALCQDSARVADQMGHESARMIFAHYRRLVKPDAAAAFWSIFPSEYVETSSESLTGVQSFQVERNPLEISVW